MSVFCPCCGQEGRVYDTWLVSGMRVRRRKCEPCNVRWKTTEGDMQPRKDTRGIKTAVQTLRVLADKLERENAP